MLAKTIRLGLVFVMLLLTLLACSMPQSTPAGEQPDMMATGFAFATQTAVSISLTQAAQSSGAGQTPAATDTPAFTLTPTLTSTPDIPLVSVSVDTNCRVGPGKIYDWVGALLVGEQAEVVGRSPQGDYFYIRNPDVPGDFCWLWGYYATTVGNISVLPIFTPPPTPTPAPDFTVTYDYMEGCVGWDPGFKVVNSGGVVFKSGYVKVTDTVTTTVVESSSDVFDKRAGCTVAESIPTLDPGDTGWLYANSYVYNPAGNAMKATITLCTQPGLAGTCISKTVQFTP